MLLYHHTIMHTSHDICFECNGIIIMKMIVTATNDAASTKYVSFQFNLTVYLQTYQLNWSLTIINLQKQNQLLLKKTK